MYPDPNFAKLSATEQKAELRRLMKVYVENPHPQRAAALREEFRKISLDRERKQSN